jgi:hypothetical protein
VTGSRRGDHPAGAVTFVRNEGMILKERNAPAGSDLCRTRKPPAWQPLRPANLPRSRQGSPTRPASFGSRVWGRLRSCSLAGPRCDGRAETQARWRAAAKAVANGYARG